MAKATDKNKDGMISIEEIEALLKQIGASDKLTYAEISK
jgi:Ca2+-binding EF-hand superfamily protein